MSREEALEIIKSHPFLFASFPDDVIAALDVLISVPPNVEEALEYLSDYDEYSPYQEAINTVITYIKDTKEKK